MKQFTLLLLSLFLIFSCGKDDEPAAACFEEPRVNDASTTCENFTTPTWACTTEAIGVFTLDENSKSFLPFFCNENKNIFNYRNESGATKVFDVDQRTYLRNIVAYDSGQPCTNDNTKNTAYCIDYEEANIRMISTDGISITTSVYTRPDFVNQSGNNAGDFLQIARIVNGNFIVDFLAVVSQKSLTFEETPEQEFYSSIDLVGTTFNDVISIDISNSSTRGTFKYYYTKDQGIVGFVDGSGTVWSLEE